MTGLPSYSTTASENVNANTGINLDEGMAPAAVNNSARQNMADVRLQWNDASWFQYGAGSKTVAATYSSATAVTFTGADATAYWHASRRVKAVGSSTGTIYGKVASSSYGGGATTVNFTWDSGSLSNEALTVYASTMPVTGKPLTLAGAGDVSAWTAFTPTLDTTGTGFTSVTYNALRAGSYKLYADGVAVHIRMITDAVTIGPASANVIIAGLPKTATAGLRAASVGYANAWAANAPISAVVLGSTATIALYNRATIGGSSVASVPSDVATGANANDIVIYAFYPY